MGLNHDLLILINLSKYGLIAGAKGGKSLSEGSMDCPDII